PDTQQMFTYILRRYRRPVVIDADGINTLALQDGPTALPENSILTPHPKEFDRLFGSHENDFDRIHTAIRQAVSMKVIIVLKGHHTFIATPASGNYFNTTGNAGLAKGGSGDVLTGIITALLAQGYTPHAATLLGVYLHGYAADRAAEALSAETMTAGDVILFLSQAFRQFSPR
ncbi:MAG TPA: NAD(P)H-hydrate dehydratase, partial [Flavisolibacter sp.]